MKPIAAVIALLLLTAAAPVQRDAENPLLAPDGSGWDAADVADPCVLQTSQGLRMWYDGNGGGYQIGTSLSTDGGRTWTRSVTPVVPRESHGVEWENRQVTAPSVVRHDGEYWMWYSGTASTTFAAGYQIGLATSTDGIRWNKYRDGMAPVLPLGPAGAGDGFSCADPHVIHNTDTNRFEMWYSGAANVGGYPLYSIWRATSADGVAWESRAMVLSEGLMCAAPAVHYNGRVYRMAYAVMPMETPTRFTEIRQRYSLDGIDWGGPADYETLLITRTGWEQNQVYSPWWLAIPDAGLQLYYCGHDATGRWHIGRAFDDRRADVAEYRAYR